MQSIISQTWRITDAVLTAIGVVVGMVPDPTMEFIHNGDLASFDPQDRSAA